MKYKCVIFDLDGTLLNTSQGILESIEYAVDTLGYPQLSYEQLLTFIGPPLSDSFMRCYGCSEEEAMRLTNAYREFYPKGAMYHAVPYDGIFELLQKLCEQDICVAVATNKPEKFTMPLLKHFGFDRYISFIHGADLEGHLKKSDLIRMCVEDAFTGSGNAARAEDVPAAASSVMIGDSVSDARGAQEAGVPFIGVTYGFGNLEEMQKYPHIAMAATPAEIRDVIL